jgi:Transposase, Mutator family
MEPTMEVDVEMENEAKQLRGVVQIDEGKIRAHLDKTVRATVEETLKALLDAEADHLCGARRYERSDGRKDTRADSCDRKPKTKAGEVTPQVPKLRKLPFETAIIERYRRRETSVEEALIEMYLAGVSVRRVEDITQALWGTWVSASTVSELNQRIYKQIEEWRQQPLGGGRLPVCLPGWLVAEVQLGRPGEVHQRSGGDRRVPERLPSDPGGQRRLEGGQGELDGVAAGVEGPRPEGRRAVRLGQVLQGEFAFHIGHARQRLHAYSLRHKAPQKLRQVIPQTTPKGGTSPGSPVK